MTTGFSLVEPAHTRRDAPAVTARRIENVAAFCAAALMVAMAALPDDRTAAGRAATDADFARPQTLGRETTFGAYLGAPYHYPSDFRLHNVATNTDITFKKVEWYTRPFENPLYYGARIQRWFAGGTAGTMIDFTHSKAYSPMQQETKLQGTIDGKPVPETGKIGDFMNKLEFTHGHNMLTLNGLLRFGGFSRFLVPYVGIGAGVSLPHSEMQRKSEPQRTYEYEYTGPTGQALAGLEFRLPTGSVFLEYKFTIADYRAPHSYRDGSLFPIDMWNQFQRWWSGTEPPGGWGETRLTSHQVVGGFLVRFAPEAAAAAP